jgi:hypothetical protein
MESAREARRRKILERGSDRIALITASQTRSDTTPPAQQSEPKKQSGATARDANFNSNLTAGEC